jgi:hypothetical protein
VSAEKILGVTEFRERLALYQLNADGGIDDSSCLTSHYLCMTHDKETGKRSDRRKRKYCTGCYNKLTAKYERQIARKKAKRVITECSTCKLAFCFTCFAKYH